MNPLKLLGNNIEFAMLNFELFVIRYSAIGVHDSKRKKIITYEI